MTKITEFGLETLDALNSLAKGNHWMQALIILYSAIDTLAWATRTSGDVTRSDFTAWVSTYIKPEQRLGCTADDLYAARCGLVHSGAADSRMAREGAATPIWYVTATARLPELQAMVARKGANAKVVCTTDLVAAFAAGVMKFAEDLEADVTKQAQVAGRIQQWLAFVPTQPVVDSN